MLQRKQTCPHHPIRTTIFIRFICCDRQLGGQGLMTRDAARGCVVVAEHTAELSVLGVRTQLRICAGNCCRVEILWCGYLVGVTVGLGARKLVWRSCVASATRCISLVLSSSDFSVWKAYERLLCYI